MNDYINKVHKVIRDGSTTIFIIQTAGDDDFWWWQVDNSDIIEFFKTHDTAFYRLYLVSGLGFTKEMADYFANHIDNTDKGASCAGYETIDEILREFQIIK